MTNEVLELNVTDELFWDPKIDSEGIAVSADDGAVTLRGTVGSFRQKREAKRAAERVYGVINVNNNLDVRVLTEQRREDSELRGDVLQALMLDAVVPTTVDATVKDGMVTLTVPRSGSTSVMKPSSSQPTSWALSVFKTTSTC
jgi:HSP20 family molecular chaperone IbpA